MLWLLLTACVVDDGDVNKNTDTQVPADDATATDGDPTDTEEVDTQEQPSDTDGTTSDTEDTEPEAQVVQFVVLGDAGEGHDTQYEVADAMATVCAKQGCDFALYLGDNFYDDGVDSVDDEQFEEKFELPYADLWFPFMVVLGNHDYGGNGAGYEYYKADYQIEYSDKSTLWNLPDSYYTFSDEHVQFFGLDTNAIMWGFGDDQQDWLEWETARSTASWKIAYGHHPYLSNGQHGNAGEYEGVPYVPVVSGGDVEDFMEASICGEVDVYFSGHDHNRQWLEPACGTEFIVSGAGAKTTDLVGRGTATNFEDDATAGFLWVEIRDDELTGQFYDRYGNLDFEQTFTKAP